MDELQTCLGSLNLDVATVVEEKSVEEGKTILLKYESKQGAERAVTMLGMYLY